VAVFSATYIHQNLLTQRQQHFCMDWSCAMHDRSMQLPKQQGDLKVSDSLLF